MRATRSYFPAGSVLAAAALVFIAGTGLVAFHGWPRVASQTAPVAVPVSATPGYHSQVSQRLRVVTSGRRVTVRVGLSSSGAVVAQPARPAVSGFGRPAAAHSGGGSRAMGHGIRDTGILQKLVPPSALLLSSHA